MSAICDAHKKVDVELLYNSVGTGSQLVWRPDQLETRCGRENQHPTEWAPRPPVEQPRRTGKKRLWPIEWGSVCCSSVRSPSPSHTQPFQIKWEVYFSKNCVARLYYCCVVINLHMSIQQEDAEGKYGIILKEFSGMITQIFEKARWI